MITGCIMKMIYFICPLIFLCINYFNVFVKGKIMIFLYNIQLLKSKEIYIHF
jgi:hypothetical protein